MLLSAIMILVTSPFKRGRKQAQELLQRLRYCDLSLQEKKTKWASVSLTLCQVEPTVSQAEDQASTARGQPKLQDLNDSENSYHLVLILSLVYYMDFRVEFLSSASQVDQIMLFFSAYSLIGYIRIITCVEIIHYAIQYEFISEKNLSNLIIGFITQTRFSILFSIFSLSDDQLSQKQVARAIEMHNIILHFRIMSVVYAPRGRLHQCSTINFVNFLCIRNLREASGPLGDNLNL